METKNPIIEAVERERTRRNLSHRALSVFLGIDPAYWHRIRTGERPLNLHTLQILVQKLPEIAPQVANFVLNQDNGNRDEGK